MQSYATDLRSAGAVNSAATGLIESARSADLGWKTDIASRCRFCGGAMDAFMSLGQQPISQVSRRSSEHRREFTYALKPAICRQCCLFQIVEVPVSTLLFHDAYPYFTGSSARMQEHLRSWAESLAGSLDKSQDPFVVEIGSNDGSFLTHIAAHGIRHLGIDPAASVANTARLKGVSVLQEFFDKDVATRIRSQHGAAALIVAANVLAHIPGIKDVAEGIAALLEDDGIFTFEAIYLGDVLRYTLIDQLYDEHVFTYSVTAVRNIFSNFGLELIDVQHKDTHGGSMRYTLAHRGRASTSDAVTRALDEEARLGFADLRVYQHFAERALLLRSRLHGLLAGLRNAGHHIAAYGATAKSTTMLNYCGIDSKLIQYVVDNTPLKQGKVLPGTHIPVYPPAHFRIEPPDYTVMLAWNHYAEIQEKEAWYMARGGKWIAYAPELTVEPQDLRCVSLLRSVALHGG